MPKTIVHLRHAPLTLRVDEMIEGPLGIREAKLKAEIPLIEGRNEVDADAWAAWLEQNKAGPLVTQGDCLRRTPRGPQ
jgi:hypothetical protein